MKTVIEQFGSAILAMVSGIVVIAILVGVVSSEESGLFANLGVATEKESEAYTSYEDYDSVVTWHDRELPSVSYEETKGRYFAEQEQVFLARYYAEDMENERYPLDKVILESLYPDLLFGKILDIRTLDGESVMSMYVPESGTITFEQAGIYEVYFTVRDRENVTSTWKIPVVVDERMS